MQHEAAANTLNFEELHRVPLGSEQIVPQQCRPLGACCGIVAGSSCTFNATVQGNSDVYGLSDLRAKKASEIIAGNEIWRVRIELFSATHEFTFPA